MNVKDETFTYKAGNATATVKLFYADSIRYEETFSAVEKDGSWESFSFTSYSGGSALRSSVKDDTITVEFSGTGIDLIGKGSSLSDILAFADGTVYAAGYSQSMGYYVYIDHANKYRTIYMHLKKDSLKVKAGQKVKAGAVLGYMGNTGNSSGAHLHFQLEKGAGNAVDPKPYLEGKSSITQTVKEMAKSALKVMHKAGLSDNPDHWPPYFDKIKYFPELLVKMTDKDAVGRLYRALGGK